MNRPRFEHQAYSVLPLLQRAERFGTQPDVFVVASRRRIQRDMADAQLSGHACQINFRLNRGCGKVPQKEVEHSQLLMLSCEPADRCVRRGDLYSLTREPGEQFECKIRWPDTILIIE